MSQTNNPESNRSESALPTDSRTWEKWISLGSALASSLAAIFAAYAAWQAAEIAERQYEGEINRIKFVFQKEKDDWEIIKMSQFAGQSYDLSEVWIIPSLIDRNNKAISPLEIMSFPTILDLDSINYNRPYPFYEIRNVKSNMCRNDACENKDILSMIIQYKIGKDIKEETLHWH